MHVKTDQVFETQRLKKLHSCYLLDTAEEREFSDLTSLAAEVCKAPIALVSLIDTSRQWFKAKEGLNVNETPRDIAFCEFAIKGAELFVVPDALKDTRFETNPLVSGAPHIRFYAGVPIIIDTYPLGTLCVIDRIPRMLDETQVKCLKLLANQVCDQIRRRNTEHSLVSTVGKLERIMALLPDALILEDVDGELLEVNHRARALFADEFRTPDGGRLLLKTLANVLSNAPTENDAEYKTKEGTVLNITRSFEKLEFNRFVTLWKIRDITNERKKQKQIEVERLQFIETIRLAALREMAGGLAHEINNPLSVIQAKSSIIKRSIQNGAIDSGQIIQNADSISRMILRISRIIFGLKVFAKPLDLIQIKEFTVGSLIDETLIFNGEKIRNSQILLDISDETKSLRIKGDIVLLSQVLLNLLNNSFDQIFQNDERWIKIEARKFGTRFEILVEDSGSPIPIHIQERLFQPFFTTKEVGKGTGLGLSISSGNMRSLGGDISYDSSGSHPRFIMSWSHSE